MSYFVYITDHCIKSAKQYSMYTVLIKLKDTVQAKQSISIFDTFPYPFIVKKQFGDRQGRLIAKVLPIQYQDADHYVVVFLDYLVKASKGYDEFCKKCKTSEMYERDVPLNAHLEEIVASEMATSPPPEKPMLSEIEKTYLWSAGTDNEILKNDDLVYESEAWVNELAGKKNESFKPRLFDAMETLPSDRESWNQVSMYSVPKTPQLSIIYTRWQQENSTILFLADLVDTSKEDASVKIKLWKDRIHATEISDLSKFVRRVYPQYILADEELWKKVEADPQSNMSLSPEEKNVLNSIYDNSGILPKFPLFINGRAGSGKSTILQYLYADYLNRALRTPEMNGLPAYFSYSSELVKNAKSFVEMLLRSNIRFHKEQEISPEWKAKLERELPNAFKDLRSYLISLLPSAAKDRFLDKNKIGYAEFKNLWQTKYQSDKKALKDYGPDISWHVIRTFIQGINPEDYLDSDDYDMLDEKQKSVDVETYSQIYHKVWDWYQKEKANNALWDDQDLVRYLLENDLIRPTFYGVFCDEAQDFTRIELEAIMRLSVFSNRKILNKQELQLIPFAFAGDELQTLNPTGFRWDATKAWFTEKFVFALYTGKLNEILNYKMLMNNYRSTNPIIKFSNSIQLYRSFKFDISGIKPQKSWHNISDAALPVTCFSPDESVFWNSLDKLEGTVFILPCQENEELEWILKDEYLSNKIIFDENGMPSITCLSSIRAKGLEFNRVVVYRFGGSDCPVDYYANDDYIEDPKSRLPYEYFINKAYVAISRPKKQLIIVDTDEGLRKFWEFGNPLYMKNNINLQKWLHSNGEWSENDIAHYSQGDDESFIEIDAPEDIIEQAKQFESRAKETRDAYLMRQAANAYKLSREESLHFKCLASAYIFENKYFEAGEIHLKAQNFNEANLCYWVSQSENSLKQIVAIGDRLNKYKTSPKYIIAYCITNKIEYTMLLSALKSTKETVFTKSDLEADAWKNLVNQALEKLFSSGEKKKIDKEFIKTVNQLEMAGLKLSPGFSGELAYCAGEFEQAIQLWKENTPKQFQKDFKDALIKTQSYPENLVELVKDSRFIEIIEQFEAHSQYLLTSEQQAIIARAHIEVGNIEKVWDIIPLLKSQESFGSLIVLSATAKRPSLLRILSICRQVFIISTENWSLIKETLEEQKREQNRNTSLYLALALARTKSLSELPIDSTRTTPVGQKSISSFLRAAFIDDISIIPEDAVLDVGIAIEKAGNRNDAIVYYQKVRDKHLGLRRKIQERYAVCLDRQRRLARNTKQESPNTQKFANTLQELGLESIDGLPPYLSTSSWNNLYAYIIDREKENEDKGLKKRIVVAHKKPVERMEPVPTAPEAISIAVPADLPAQNTSVDPPITQSTEQARNDQPTPKKPEATQNPTLHTDPIRFTVLDYKIDYYRAKDRLNVEAISSGEQFSFKEKVFASTDFKFEPTQEEPGIFLINETPFSFEIKENELVLMARKEGLSLGFSP